MAEYLISLSLLIAVILFIRGIFRRTVSPRAIYALWLAVVIRMLLPAALFEVDIGLPDFLLTDQIEASDTQREQVETSYGLTAQVLPGDPTQEPVQIEPQAPIISAPDAPIPIDSAAPEESADVTIADKSSDAAENPIGIDWGKIAGIIWLVGSVLAAAWVILTSLSFNYQLHSDRSLRSTIRGTKVYVSGSAGVPCIAGLIPSIYITPEAADSESEELIILHEHTHISHGDHIWSVIRAVALIAFWLNPLIWLAAKFSKLDAELACDDSLAAGLDYEARLKYARILLDTLPQQHRYAVGFGSAPLKERLQRLTGKRKNSRICLALAVICALSAAGCSFIGVNKGASGYDFDLDTLIEHIQSEDISALELFAGADAGQLDNQFADLLAYYSGTSEKVGGQWEALPESGVILPEELTVDNCDKFEYGTLAQTPVVLRYDAGDYWLYAGFALLDVGTTGDLSEIIWHLCEAWFIPKSEETEPPKMQTGVWNIYYSSLPGVYTHGGYRCSGLKLFNTETGESYYEAGFSNDSMTEPEFAFIDNSGGRLLMECSSHGFVILDLTGEMYASLTLCKDFYIAYNNEFGEYIPGTARWLNENQLHAEGTNGAFILTITDGQYDLTAVDTHSFDPDRFASLIPNESAQPLFRHRIHDTNDYLYFCAIRTLDGPMTGYTDDPPKDFAIYHVNSDSPNIIGYIAAELPPELEYDTVCPVLALGGEGRECEFILRLSRGSDVFYVSFYNSEADDHLAFAYRGILPEERLKELKLTYPDSFGDTENPSVSYTLADFWRGNPGGSLVYEGYTVEHSLPNPYFPEQSLDFHLHLPQINADSPEVEKWNGEVVGRYESEYGDSLRRTLSGTNGGIFADVTYSTVTTGDVVTICIIDYSGIANSGAVRLSYDISHYDTVRKKFLSADEFIAYYAKGQFAGYTLSDIVKFMNEHAFVTDEIGNFYPITEEDIQGVVPSVFGDGKLDVVFTGYSIEGSVTERMLLSPYPTHTYSAADYTYRMVYYEYTGCREQEMYGHPAGYRLLLSKRSQGNFSMGYYAEPLFLEDIAEPPEGYIGDYYSPIETGSDGRVYLSVDADTDSGHLKAKLPFEPDGDMR